MKTRLVGGVSPPAAAHALLCRCQLLRHFWHRLDLLQRCHHHHHHCCCLLLLVRVALLS